MAAITPEAVLDALRPIQDPDFNRSIVDLEFVKDIQIEGGKVRFKIELTTPACPIKEKFREAAHQRVSALDGVTDVEVMITSQPPKERAAGGPEVPAGLVEVQDIIAVASGKGGVGKSTVAVNLALGLRANGAEVGLLDCDIYGPSIPLMTDISGHPRVTAQQKIQPLQGHGLKLMSVGFIASDDGPLIWRGPMVHGILTQFLRDVDWGKLDYLVLDLPPGTGDAALTVTQAAPLTGAVIVTTPQEVALIDARKGLRMFQQVDVPVLGIVENMAYFIPPDLPDRRYYIFGESGAAESAERLGVPLLAQIPLQPDVVEATDAGRPTTLHNADSPAGLAFRELAGNVVRRISVLRAET